MRRFQLLVIRDIRTKDGIQINWNPPALLGIGFSGVIKSPQTINQPFPVEHHPYLETDSLFVLSGAIESFTSMFGSLEGSIFFLRHHCVCSPTKSIPTISFQIARSPGRSPTSKKRSHLLRKSRRCLRKLDRTVPMSLDKGSRRCKFFAADVWELTKEQTVFWIFLMDSWKLEVFGSGKWYSKSQYLVLRKMAVMRLMTSHTSC